MPDESPRHHFLGYDLSHLPVRYVPGLTNGKLLAAAGQAAFELLVSELLSAWDGLGPGNVFRAPPTR